MIKGIDPSFLLFGNAGGGEEQGTDRFSPTPFPFPPLKTGMGLIGRWRYERE
jgi:hypothetical protein